MVCVLHFSFRTKREEAQGSAGPKPSLYRWRTKGRRGGRQEIGEGA